MRKLLLILALATTAVAQQPDAPRITPQRPIAELRQEALAAQPPQESGKRAPDLVEITSLDPTIKLDIRYATENNFLSTPVYEQARAFLQEPAAKALVKAHRWLKPRGYGLLIHDAYRPWYVTKIFWDATPPAHRSFVADPATGSRHNRGAAVDLTLYDLKTGQPVEMPSLYDEFSPRAHPSYSGGTAEQRRLRDLLRQAMERHGFKVIENEWWHFDYKDWQKYPILNVRFESVHNLKIPTSAPLATSTPEPIRPAGLPLPDRPVVIWAIIGADGRVQEAKVARSVTPEFDRQFDHAALEAVRKWQFKPATKDGKPVSVQVNIEVNFRGTH